MEATTDRLTDTREQALSALAEHSAALQARNDEIGSTELPAPRLYAHRNEDDSRTVVRIEPGYGFLRVCWGPRYVNTWSELDAERFEAFGKRYQRTTVYLYPLDDREPETFDVGPGQLTDAARPVAFERAAEILEAFAEDHADYYASWIEASERHDASWIIDKEASMVRQAIADLREVSA